MASRFAHFATLRASVVQTPSPPDALLLPRLVAGEVVVVTAVG
jgi:hypothetical protein